LERRGMLTQTTNHVTVSLGSYPWFCAKGMAPMSGLKERCLWWKKR
jgi:hypothetical protein